MEQQEIKEAISFLEDCHRIHIEWAEYFERNPEIEAAKCATGEWDDSKTYRKLAHKYGNVIRLLEAKTIDIRPLKGDR